MKGSKNNAKAKLRSLVEATASRGRVKFMVRGENEDWTAIDADRESLEFLGNALLALASDDLESCIIFDSPGPFCRAGSDGLIFYKDQPTSGGRPKRSTRS